MINKDKTEICILLDRSGSMQSIKKDMEGGFQEFLKTQKELPGECLVTLYQFDSVLERIYQSRPIQEIQELRIEPRSWTRLYDSACEAITEFGQQLSKLPVYKRPANVVFIVITDGENNQGDPNPEKMRAMVQHQESVYKWQFVYMGANQDAYAVGKSMGFNFNSTLSYNASPLGATGMMGVLCRSVSEARSGGVYSMTEADRVAAADGLAISKPPAI